MEIVKLRKEVITKRQQLSNAAQQQLSFKICQHVSHTVLFQQSNTIAFYLAVNGEVNCQWLIAQAWQHNKTCYLPILQHQQLAFIRYTSASNLTTNRYGIPEPAMDEQLLLAPDQLDLVLTPLVAFDDQCSRIGMGAGYYDRTFAFTKNSADKPKLIGLAYEFQKVARIQPQSWDVTLHHVITERKIY